MSGNYQARFFPSDLKEEKIEIASGEEFQVSEYQAGPLYGSTFTLSTSTNSNWNTCLKTEESPDAADSESIPIYAASLLEPSFMEHEGTRNGVKAEEDSLSLFCDSSFPEERRNSNETLETSLKDSSGSAEQQERLKRAQCPNCPRHFEIRSLLRYHVQTAHSDERPFQCEVCSAGFKRSFNLKQHLQTHSDERPFKCTVCLADFRTLGSLKQHLLTHSDERPFKCELCSSSFKTSACLKQHLQIHSDERGAFKCKVCPAEFRTSRNLSSHLRFHSDDRPFKCKVCTACFKTPSNLRKHLLVHSDERPFKCELCSSAFKTYTNLKQHRRTHSDERQFAMHFTCEKFVCEICSADFEFPWRLKRHLLRIHNG